MWMGEYDRLSVPLGVWRPRKESECAEEGGRADMEGRGELKGRMCVERVGEYGEECVKEGGAGGKR